MLADLVDRGLDPEQAILFVIDGGKAIRRAIKDVFGEHALVPRCRRRYPDLWGYADLGGRRPANSAVGGLKVGMIRSG